MIRTKPTSSINAKISFHKLLLCILTLNIYGSLFAGTIVLIRGTSCSGKTSIASTISKLDSTWKTIDEDILYFDYTLSFIAQHYPQEYAALSQVIEPYNMYHALKYNVIVFKNNVTQEQKAYALCVIKQIQDELNTCMTSELTAAFDTKFVDIFQKQILSYTEQGYNVAIAYVSTPIDIHELCKKNRLYTALMYCPVECIMNRLHKRNNKAIKTNNFYEMRFFRPPLYSFNLLYAFTTQNTPDTISCWDKEKALNALEQLETSFLASPFLSSKAGNFTRGDFSINQFMNYKHNMLDILSSPCVYIRPRIPFDFFLSTQGKPIEQCAQQILDFVLQQKIIEQ